MNSSTFHTLTLPAGATVPLAATGNRVFVRRAVQNFRLSIDGSIHTDLEESMQWRAMDGRTFTRLELTNPHAVALVVEIYVGDASIERLAPQFMREAETTLAGFSYTIAPNGVIAIPASPLGRHRKEIIITNDGPNHSLILYSSQANASGDLIRICKIFVNQSMALPTSAAIYARNSGGVDTIDVYAMELNYA